MRFETIPAGESRQLDGPWFGVRVLSAGDAASVQVDRLVLPMSVLAAYRRRIETVIATGPVVLALADAADEDVGALTASPQPPSPGGRVRLVEIVTIPEGNVVGRGHDGVAGRIVIGDLVAHPAWARRVEVFVESWAGSIGVPV